MSHARLLILVAIAGCGRKPAPAPAAPAEGDAAVAIDAAPEPAAARPDRQQALDQLVKVVILPDYEALKSGSSQLASALVAAGRTPTAESVSMARTAWQAARALWRRTNAYGIGPADDLALTGGIIDEPTDAARLERLLSAETPLDATAVRSVGANQRGLLAIEYLLYEPPGSAPEQIAAALTSPTGSRRALYLELLGGDLDAKIGAVVEAWRSRYGQELAQAGRGSTEFKLERDALNALLNKALAITDRTIDILRQATGGMTTRVGLPVSTRSDWVVPDLLQDLAGLGSLYIGRSPARPAALATVSVGDAVRDMNPIADAELRRALQTARELLEAIPRPVRASAPDAEPVVRAIAGLRLLKAALGTGVFNALGVSIGFSDNDGD